MEFTKNLEVAVMSYEEVMTVLRKQAEREIRVIVDEHRRIVAIVFGADICAVPDANLYAASPELYSAACRTNSLLQLLDNTDTVSNAALAAAVILTLDAVRAAIAKASGPREREAISDGTECERTGRNES